MKLEALDHPKTLDFAARLGVELPTAIGYLELLWAFTGKKSPQGNIGKWPDGAIARACYYMGDPALFLEALTLAGFVDRHPEHRYVIHDWADHCPRWVSAKLKKLGASFSGNGPPVDGTAVATAVATTEPSPRARAIPREDKPREGKGEGNHAQERTAERTQEPTGEGFGSPRALAERNVNPGAAHELVQRIQGIYPAGTYRAADWLLGERELSKLLDSGEDPEHLVRLTREFRAQQDAKGSTGTQFVMAPHKFFGPEGHWRGPHHLPKSQGDTVREDFLRRFGSKTGTQA